MLSADAVITRIGQPTIGNEPTSFGESINKENESLREETNKIQVINDSLCIAFAGDVDIAKEIFRLVKLQLSEKEILLENIAMAFERSLDAIRPFKIKDIPSFIVGAIIENKPQLLSFNITKRVLLDTHKYLVQAGSMKGIYKQLTIEYFKEQVGKTLKDETRLIVFNSIIQLYGIHDNLLESNVGGIISGLFVNKNGVSWQNDTCYIVYSIKDKSPEASNLIRMMVRKNIVIVHSPLRNGYFGFTDILMEALPSGFIQKWENNWKQEMDSFDFKYVVFLAKEYRKVTVVKNEKNGEENNFINFKAINNKHALAAISEELMKTLYTLKLPDENGMEPLDIHFLC